MSIYCFIVLEADNFDVIPMKQSPSLEEEVRILRRKVEV